MVDNDLFSPAVTFDTSPVMNSLWGYDRRVTSTLPCSAVVSINILYLYAFNKKWVNGRNSADKNSWWLLLFLSLENHFFCFLFCCNIRVRINEKWKCYIWDESKIPHSLTGNGNKRDNTSKLVHFNVRVIYKSFLIVDFWFK